MIHELTISSARETSCNFSEAISRVSDKLVVFSVQCVFAKGNRNVSSASNLQVQSTHYSVLCRFKLPVLLVSPVGFCACIMC